MAHTALVQVLNSRYQLPVESGGLLLLESSISHNEVKQFTSIGMLHDHEEFLLSLNDLIELNDIGVADLLENLDLSGDSLHILLIIDLLLLQDLDCNLLASEDVSSLLHLSESTFAQWLTKNVMANGDIVLVLHILKDQLLSKVEDSVCLSGVSVQV